MMEGAYLAIGFNHAIVIVITMFQSLSLLSSQWFLIGNYNNTFFEGPFFEEMNGKYIKKTLNCGKYSFYTVL